MPRVLLVDDEPHIIEGLTDTLRGEPFGLVSAGSAAEARAILHAGGIDVLVTDDEMPGEKGVDLVTDVHRLYPEVVNILLTGKANLAGVIRAINDGHVFKLLTKPCPPLVLREAIRGALTHRALTAVSSRILEFSRNAGSSLSLAPAQPLVPPPVDSSDPLLRLPVADQQALSAREKEILRAVMSGHATAEVARRLFISVHTARNHIKTIYRKLAVHSRTELMGKLLSRPSHAA